MPKRSVLNRLLQLQIGTCIVYVICLIAVIQFFTSHGKYNYSHTPRETIDDVLYKKTAPKLVPSKNKPDCTYDNVLGSKKTINVWDVPKKFDDFPMTGLHNGSYSPEECNPLFSVAILVTYRNRQRQLDTFLPYMHNYLRKQNIHYKIYVIEQQDNKPWNKGALYNIGAKYAIADKFPCLVFHDVDLLPLDASNLYACTKSPRHLSASIDKFRFVLTYDWLVGGVFAMQADQYTEVNGYSNKFKGWGGEDDDFYERLSAKELDVIRFPREMSRYTMLVHPHEQENAARYRVMSHNQAERTSGSAGSADGYSAVDYQSILIKPNRLFTLIAVNL